ncbi:helix-turn-helix transcriptional regulator [Mesorhizobium sp. B1-1-8]|uniref:helix-turn-helix transcriptional regulator n=1 Tax=Mesorhizobium sp. B1-1-8 TaxID=2589976 RepID=UPI001126CECD|nr:helix-turn-helix transcriptional regulator [Mesorhizobium sp. B1-1-8]UCI10746.1 helix-turn-helix transcriptional regulator [Mesorhizobium sp. B1-1-8]
MRRFNERAAALFGSDLIVRHGRIRAIDQPSDARLQGFIRAAVSGVSVRSEPVVITRKGYPCLIADVMPMTALGHDLFPGGDVLLYFTDLLNEPLLNEQLLSLTFKLTRAEARLASKLASGEGIRTASAELGISRETARTQLRAVFAKTGTRRQAELAALLSRLRKPSLH